MVIACFKIVSSSPSGTRAIRILVVVVARHAREGVAWTAEGHRDVWRPAAVAPAYLRNWRTAVPPASRTQCAGSGCLVLQVGDLAEI